MRRAFTLIEMIVVLAITAVMMGLIIVPIVQSFNFTRTTQALTEGQEKGRQLIETITREVNNSAGVRDNEGTAGTIAVVVPGDDGNPATALFEYAKLDVFKPAQGDPALRGPGGGYINPDTGREDPTLKAPKGQVNVPAAPGGTITRYFLGLKNPLAADNLNPAIYYNPHVDYKRTGGLPWMIAGEEDNLVVLYRAEVQPKVLSGGVMVVNTTYFEDLNGDGEPDMDDPYFFVMNAPGTPPLAGAAQAAKAQRILNWKRAAQIVTEFNNYDMIQPLYDKASRKLLVNGTLPRLVSLMQFRPSTVASEPAEGSVAVRLGEENDDARGFAPDIFKTKHRGWSSPVVRFYPAGYDPNNPAANEYLICRLDDKAGVRKGRVYAYDPDLDPDLDDRTGEGVPADDMEVFDLVAYENQVTRGGIYPFTRGAAASDARSGWASSARGRNAFHAFSVDKLIGSVTSSFGIEQWGIDDPTATLPPRADKNVPLKDTGNEFTPASEPFLGGNFYDPGFAAINQKFNKVWNDNPALQVAGSVHRFVDLRVVPSPDGTISPLYPDPATGFTGAQVVPGSEVVTGPSQTPGPGYGLPVRYSRVTKNPGPNQYVINYSDLPEPNWATLGYAAPPAVYTPTDFVSAILQPRYKAGYVQLNSDPNVPLPTGAITVSYRFQFTRPSDMITVDYDTRDAMTILLTIRNYSESTLPNPQSITLKGSAALRNVIR